MNPDGDTRLYGSAIAIVSGVYSIASAATGGMGSMPASTTMMLVVGALVLLHGILLLTPVASRLGRSSGLLMIGWAAIMLANQTLAVSMSDGGMGATAWDGGMVAIAVLMLVSGLIMSRHRTGSGQGA